MSSKCGISTVTALFGCLVPASATHSVRTRAAGVIQFLLFVEETPILPQTDGGPSLNDMVVPKQESVDVRFGSSLWNAEEMSWEMLQKFWKSDKNPASGDFARGKTFHWESPPRGLYFSCIEPLGVADALRRVGQ